MGPVQQWPRAQLSPGWGRPAHQHSVLAPCPACLRSMIQCLAYDSAGYDYTVLIAMSPSIQAVFFPPGDLAAKQLSFW